MNGPADSAYDVIVLGAGPVGQTVATRAGAAGLSVAAVERELVGASAPTGRASPARRCCGRSRRWPMPGGSRGRARRSPGRQTPRRCSPAASKYVVGWNDEGQASWLKSTGTELIRGHGRLDGPRRRTDRCQGHRGAPRGRHRTGHPDPWKRAMSWRPTRCCSRPGAWKNKSTRPPSPWPLRSPSAVYGTPCLAFPSISKVWLRLLEAYRG